MAGDRHDDRRDAAESSEQTLAQGRRMHMRESVHQTLQNIRSRAARGQAAADGGHGIDRHFDRVVSEQKNHTPDRPGQARDGDGITNDALRAGLEDHRREMQLAAAAQPTNGRGEGLLPRRRDEEEAPRRAELRDPRHPEAPSRPSITTLAQRSSYGPQNFSRTDVIDKPRTRGPIRMGGGPNIPQPAARPTPASGYESGRGRNRDRRHHAR